MTSARRALSNVMTPDEEEDGAGAAYHPVLSVGCCPSKFKVSWWQGVKKGLTSPMVKCIHYAVRIMP